MAYTKKPCPGCGQVDRDRKADEVCRQCRQTLDHVAEIEAEGERLRATVADALLVATTPRTLYFPDSFYGIGENRDAISKSPEYQSFALATAAMIKALTAPSDRGRKPERYRADAVPAPCSYSLREGGREHHGVIEASDTASQAMRQWWKDLQTFARTCFAAGVNDGRDLLGQLASGTITLDQLNDRAMEMTRRR
jgi:hypothetical protein